MAEADPPLIREEAKPWGKKLLLFGLGKKKDKCFPSLLRGAKPALRSVLNIGFLGLKPR